MTATELIYHIHNKEILAIVSDYKEWRKSLEGVENSIVVLYDYKNLEFFTMTKVHNCRQAR
jgi:hypothetical protein